MSEAGSIIQACRDPQCATCRAISDNTIALFRSIELHARADEQRLMIERTAAHVRDFETARDACIERFRGLGKHVVHFAESGVDVASWRQPDAHGQRYAVMLPHKLVVRGTVGVAGSVQVFEVTDDGERLVWSGGR